jgi:hypothetical protein
MQELSITRALAELKLLNDRITRKVSDSTFVSSNKKSAKKVNNVYSIDEFNEMVKANYQSIVDLIKRRKLIKSAIVESNAKTIVTIGGKEMTVADAIERKESISYDKILLQEMERQYKYALAKVQSENDKVQVKLDELLIASFGKEGKQKVSEDEINIIANPYREANEYQVIDVLDLKNKIEELKTSIEDFELNVDFELSTSNAITKIEIPD